MINTSFFRDESLTWLASHLGDSGTRGHVSRKLAMMPEHRNVRARQPGTR